MPAVIGLPLLLGYLRLEIQRAGVVDTAEGVAISMSILLVVVGAVVLIVGRSLDRADARRQALEDRLKRQADRDPLTDLYNRPRFEGQLRLELGRVSRHRHPLALIIVDVSTWTG
jgi:predicted signal transduction protein with EAL and GGDEF domain